MLVLAVEAVVVGVLEAALLVLAVGAGLAVADGSDSMSAPVPYLGTGTISTASALLLAACCGVATAGLHLNIAWLNARLSASILRRIRQDIVAAFEGASWARQASESEGALQETATTLGLQSSSASATLIGATTQVLGGSALVLVAVVVHPVATLVVALLGAAIVVGFRPVARATRRRARTFVDQNSEFATAVAQWGAMAMEHRLFGVSELRARALLDTSDGVSRSFRGSRFVALAGSSLFRDVALIFLVAAVAAVRTGDGLDLASIGAVVLLVVRALGYATAFTGALQTLNQQTPSIAALEARLQVLRADTSAFGDREVRGFQTLAVVDVTYAYAPGEAALSDVSLAIDRGDAIGIVGPSGGGKSTLVQILLRLRVPSSGRVLLDGVDYKEISPRSWSRLVALVPQEAHLFEGTIFENIRFYRPDVDEDAVMAASRAAHIHDEIRRLPRGYATCLGPRGSGLSGGQAQRVSIARALAGAPELLVMDEPTSALDVRAEQLLRSTIKELRGRVTLIIVAHRTTTLSECNRVVAIADGRVRAEGTLDEAMASVSLVMPDRRSVSSEASTHARSTDE